MIGSAKIAEVSATLSYISCLEISRRYTKPYCCIHIVKHQLVTGSPV